MMKYILSVCFVLSTISLFGQSQTEYEQLIETYRKAYFADFLKKERSPIKTEKDLEYVKFFDAKLAYRLEASFERTPKAPVFDMATYSGVTKKYVQYGILRFELEGKQYQLAIYRNVFLQKMAPYKNHLFLPFKDLTNGEQSYGGGRYIDLKTTDIKEGKVIIDFNKCYNPWCAYSDGYSCPIPPQENHLTIAIEAGEKNYGKK